MGSIPVTVINSVICLSLYQTIGDCGAAITVSAADAPSPLDCNQDSAGALRTVVGDYR